MSGIDDIHPVAIRFNPRGEGWTYAGADAAAYWQARCQDAEFLYTAEALTLAEQRARAAGRAEAVAELRADAQGRRDLAQGSLCDEQARKILRAEAWTILGAAKDLEARSKAPAERQDARDGQEGTGAGSDAISRAGGGGAFAGDGR